MARAVFTRGIVVLLRRLLLLLLLVLVLAGAALGYGWWWRMQPLEIAPSPAEVTIARGASAKTVAQTLVAAGVFDVPVQGLYAWLRLSGQGSQVKAGYYEFASGDTPAQVMQRLIKGEQSLKSITFVEGWTFAQMRQLLAQQPLAHETRGLSDAQVMEKLGRQGMHPEGRFFPDTYLYAKGSSDLAVLKQSLEAMDRMLEAAWQQRERSLPLKTPDEALILASIVEKETGRDSDRRRIAGVFVNRLNKGMLLQTDPTVIYGLGQQFDGRLRKRHLQTDTPWNTYTRAGLPPTPIAMPGRASLLAAVQPEKTTAYYFVARGDGSSEFSETLQQHNRAVDRYIRGKP
ncbi:endolytic transglycosylase MltG [Comamonadaceae bacterium OH3737_COT-264]|nr:endolytic transglycosylase MltG [Comamonadaceae bacterium OH3737_COT-264]